MPLLYQQKSGNFLPVELALHSQAKFDLLGNVSDSEAWVSGCFVAVFSSDWMLTLIVPDCEILVLLVIVPQVIIDLLLVRPQSYLSFELGLLGFVANAVLISLILIAVTMALQFRLYSLSWYSQNNPRLLLCLRLSLVTGCGWLSARYTLKSAMTASLASFHGLRAVCFCVRVGVSTEKQSLVSFSMQNAEPFCGVKSLRAV